MSNDLIVTQPNRPAWARDLPVSSRIPIFYGFSLLAFGVVGFGLWAAMAPIEGAVVAPGVFVATSQNKVIQHLEGGIIREIKVREGQLVEAGETLVLLDETQPRADLRRLTLRQSLLRATAARLTSEASHRDSPNLPDDLMSNTDTDVRTIVESQQAIFAARRQKLLSEIAIQEQAIASFEHRIKGERARQISAESQITLIETELSDKEKLLQMGLVRRPEYFALRRVHETLKSEILRAQADLADNEERIRGLREQIERARRLFVQTAVEELQPIHGELKDINERLTAAHAVLERIEVRAPVRGIVVKINYHTSGGVIRPGNDILVLLPLGEELLVQSNVRPQDIESLSRGQDAMVRLTALNQRTTPTVPGRLVYVSADALPAERANADNAFVIRVQLQLDKVAELKDFLPTPGMPAEVYIRTGERSFFRYLVQPIIDTMARAFREA